MSSKLQFFFVLAAHQMFVKKDGLFTHDLFQNSNFVCCLLSIFVEGLIYNVFTVSCLYILID